LDSNHAISDNNAKLYIQDLLSKNDILKKYILNKNDKIYIEFIENFDINDYFKIIHINHKKFNSYMDKMLNSPFNTLSRWSALFCIDKTNQKTRFYFKIDHSYADGYQIIKILTSPFKKINKEKITQKFKRKTNFLNTIYHYIIGTLILISINLRFVMKMLYNNFCLYFIPFRVENAQSNSSFPVISSPEGGILNEKWSKKNDNNLKRKHETDYIILKNINFERVKKFTKEKNITINDFLYCLMIKTHYAYTKKKQNITTCSPINVSNTTDTNNMIPLFLNIDNHLNSDIMLKQTHDIFNNCKYSLFIPIMTILIHKIIPLISNRLLDYLFNVTSKQYDIVYSNIIGPSYRDVNNNINKNKFNFLLSDIHFVTTTTNSEFTFNIISFDKNINSVLSFRKGMIKNKNKFKKCFYETYQKLIDSL